MALIIKVMKIFGVTVIKVETSIIISTLYLKDFQPLRFAV